MVLRNQRWLSIWLSGGGDIDDALKADFGDKGPVNIQKSTTTDLNHRFKYSSYLSDPSFRALPLKDKAHKLSTISGYELDGDIFIHPLKLKISPDRLLNPGIQKFYQASSTDSHEFTHVCQYMVQKAGWKGYKPWNTLDSLSDQKTKWGFERFAALEDRLHSLDKLGQSWEEAKTGEFGIGRYLGKNNEIQARLHQIIVAGYQQWQKLPLTKTELWAALASFGLETPPEIQNLLKSDEGQKALETFKLLPSLKTSESGTVQELNAVYQYASDPSIQRTLWTAQYPLLYGELLEFYGDVPGRSRMELGPNPMPAIHITKKLTDKVGTALSENEANELAQAIPPELAICFINNLIGTYKSDSAGFDNALKICRLVLSRPDVKAEVLDKPHINVENLSGLNAKPPLETAIERNNKPMIRLLIEAGANPFQTYNYLDAKGNMVCHPQRTANNISTAILIHADTQRWKNLPQPWRARFNHAPTRERIKKNMETLSDSLHEMMEAIETGDKKYSITHEGKTKVLSFEEGLSWLQIPYALPRYKQQGQEPSAPQIDI